MTFWQVSLIKALKNHVNTHPSQLIYYTNLFDNNFSHFNTFSDNFSHFNMFLTNFKSSAESVTCSRIPSDEGLNRLASVWWEVLREVIDCDFNVNINVNVNRSF